MHLINNLAMAIKTASAEKDFLGIRKIWEERFTTDPIYLNTIFEKVFPLCRSYVFSGGEGEILSVISLMPMKFYAPEISGTASDGYLKGYYLFGVATLEKATGNHHAAALIEYASRQLAIEGYDFIFERPANQELINFYLKFGFTKLIKKQRYSLQHIQKLKITPYNTPQRDIETISDQILTEIRDDFKTRLEWVNTTFLKKLIELGEIDRHNELQTSESLQERCFIAVKILNNTPDSIFNNAFFCFPME